MAVKDWLRCPLLKEKRNDVGTKESLRKKMKTRTEESAETKPLHPAGWKDLSTSPSREKRKR